tara:strand:- start:26635 stop:31275 length:4641 start_codon:yes stop_codon:yes gene_type:complete
MTKGLKKLLSATIIFIASFQLAFAETAITAARYPAEIHELSLEQLRERIETFKVKIKGKEDTSHCDEREAPMFESDRPFTSAAENAGLPEFDELLSDMRVNSCGQYARQWDATPEEAANADECLPIKTPGMLDKLAENVMQFERDERRRPTLRLDDAELRATHQEAELLLRETRKWLIDRDADEEELREMLVTYLGSVALPMRDLVVARRAYFPGEYDGAWFYQSLLPEFPTRLFPTDDMNGRDRIKLGPNPSVDPYHFAIEDRSFGRSQIRIDENTILSRDVITLMKAPSTLNYVRALKLMTLHMMMSQLYVYESMQERGAKNIDIPRSCQNHFNGDLPSKMRFDFVEGQGEEFLDNMLANHGLTFSPSNYQFIEYYMENAGKDPTKAGYSGLMPFEEVLYAQKGLEQSRVSGLTPDIDDITHFERVMQFKLPEAMDEFHGSTFSWFGLRDSRAYTYNGKQLFEKIVADPSPYELYEVEVNGEKIPLEPQRQNLSLYLVELMQKKGATHFQEIISKSLERKMKSTAIQLSLPNLYGASVWRQWGLGLLAKALRAGNDQNFHNIIKDRCARTVNYSQHHVPGINEIALESSKAKVCVRNDSAKTVENLLSYLSEFEQTGEYVPLRRLEEAKVSEVYPLLKSLWNGLISRTSLLDEAKTNEYDYLSDQMEAMNPWAKLRLGYLVAKEELSAYRQGHEPEYQVYFSARDRMSPYSARSQCFYNNVDSIIGKFDKASRKLGLTRTLSPSYANTILSSGDKESFWQSVVQTADEGNSQLFSVKSGGKDLYSKLQNVSYQTLLDRDSVEDFVSDSGHRLDDRAEGQIDEVFESDEAKLGEFFMRLYALRGKPQEQQQLFNDFSVVEGIDNAFMAKLNFLSLDNELKRPIYKSMVREAATVRAREVKNRMQEFCNMEPNKHEDMKALFYATTKAQNQVNSLAGLPGVPENVLDKINSMSPDEWKDLWLGLGAGLLGMAAILIGAACTGVTGGLCAPLGVAMIAAGTSAMGMQITLIKREYERKQDADEYQKQVKLMEELGFADYGSNDSVSRGWAWTTIEAISVFPLIGIVGRSVGLGSKLVLTSAKHIVRGTGKVAFRQAAKTAVQETDVRLARYVLGFGRLKDAGLRSVDELAQSGARELGEMTDDLLKAGMSPAKLKEGVEEIRKVTFLHRKGRISASLMAKKISDILGRFRSALGNGLEAVDGALGRVVVSETKGQIDAQAAKMVSQYFGHNPNGLLRLIKSYSGKRLDNAVRSMQRIEDGKGFFARIPLVGKMVNGIKKMRVAHLAANADRIRGLEAGLEQVVKNGGDLEKFIAKNMEDLTEVMIKVPMRKRELPYLFFLEGGYHYLMPYVTRRLPFIGAVSDGMIMKQLFNARARLVYESLRAEARVALGVAPYVAAETTLGVFRSFEQSVAHAVDAASGVEARRLTSELQGVKGKIVDTLQEKLREGGIRSHKFRHQLSSATNFDAATIERIVFAPANIDEEALGGVLWEALKTEEIFKLSELGEIAHKVAQQLAHYNNADDFDRYLAALKVLTIKRDPGVVQIF